RATAQDPVSLPVIPPGQSAEVRWTLHDEGAELGPVEVGGEVTWRWHRTSQVGQTATTFHLATPIEPGEHYLSDLDWVEASSYWGPIERDMSNGEQAPGDGGPITIAGTTYAKGLGLHAPSSV